jgi:Synergist-CTERM protein sorting domain-containing protein
MKQAAAPAKTAAIFLVNRNRSTSMTAPAVQLPTTTVTAFSSPNPPQPPSGGGGGGGCDAGFSPFALLLVLSLVLSRRW